MTQTSSQSELRLSVVIPAWNEETRLPPHLNELRKTLDERWPDAYEVIVVDDGSTDRTAEVVADYQRRWHALKMMHHVVNFGKGAAVRTGMMAASGAKCLFLDADGATHPAQIARLMDAIEAGADVAVGVRSRGTIRAWHRRFASWTFRKLVQGVLGLSLRDSQCGCKLFSATAKIQLFPFLRENGYLFDLAILAAARRASLRVVEVEIAWNEVPHSKIRLLHDSRRMLTGVFRLRRQLRSQRECLEKKSG